MESTRDPVEDLRQKVSEKSLELKLAIAALEQASGEQFIKFVPHLNSSQLANCQVLRSRYHILEFMPRGAVCMEVGTQTGHFAQHIVDITKPRELHLLDLSIAQIDPDKLAAYRSTDWIHLHEGDSAAVMADLPDDYFDFIYIDGDHSYEGVTKDLSVARRKLKANGFLICNDYTVWSPPEVAPYGIMRAVHELCVEENWEFVYIGLQGQGYHDVCIRRRVGNLLAD